MHMAEANEKEAVEGAKAQKGQLMRCAGFAKLGLQIIMQMTVSKPELHKYTLTLVPTCSLQNCKLLGPRAKHDSGTS